MLPRVLLLLLLVEGALATLHYRIAHAEAAKKRVVRQTFVNSSGIADGKGDSVVADAAAQHYKNSDGTIGMNVTSTGNATGGNAAGIGNNAGGQVGGKTVGSNGSVNATGANSSAFSDIFAEIYGDMMSITNYQEGRAAGSGDTQVQSNGGSAMSNNGTLSPSASNNSVATAGATGSNSSIAEISSNQILTWDQLIAQLNGHAAGSGKTNAQANVDLGAGNANNGIEVNGLVSGVNANGGDVSASVNGSGAMNGKTHELSGNMAGAVNGTGPSQLVGASNLQSNMTGNNLTIAAFGDAKAETDGESAIGLNSNTSASRENGANGTIGMNNNVNGTTKNMTVQNGLQVQDPNGGTLAVGYGEIKGNGTENSAANINVDSKYNSNGEAQVVATGNGSAVSKDRNSSLAIEGNGIISNANGTKSGDASASGGVMGAYNNLTGTNQVAVGSTGTGGSAYMEANGGGPGNSAANTNANLTLKDGGVDRTSSVSGSVQATGDNTSVKSISSVTDQNGVQTLNNMQHATSQSKGSSSASASNGGWLKRRKRASLGVLFDKLF